MSSRKRKKTAGPSKSAPQPRPKQKSAADAKSTSAGKTKAEASAPRAGKKLSLLDKAKAALAKVGRGGPQKANDAPVKSKARAPQEARAAKPAASKTTASGGRRAPKEVPERRPDKDKKRPGKSTAAAVEELRNAAARSKGKARLVAAEPAARELGPRSEPVRAVQAKEHKRPKLVVATTPQADVAKPRASDASSAGSPGTGKRRGKLAVAEAREPEALADSDSDGEVLAISEISELRPREDEVARVEHEGEAAADPDAEQPATEAPSTRAHMKHVIESLIFVSDQVLTLNQIGRLVKAKQAEVRELLAELSADYSGRGIELVEVAGGFQFRSSPASAPFVRDLVAQRPVRLTRAQLETLALIAYRQPITRPEIDDVRGVDSGSAIKVLLERDLVKILGRKDEAGRPLLYGTAPYFLQFFSMKSMQDLPTLREFTELNAEHRELFQRKTGEIGDLSAEEFEIQSSQEDEDEDEDELPLEARGAPAEGETHAVDSKDSSETERSEVVEDTSEAPHGLSESDEPIDEVAEPELDSLARDSEIEQGESSDESSARYDYGDETPDVEEQSEASDLEDLDRAETPSDEDGPEVEGYASDRDEDDDDEDESDEDEESEDDEDESDEDEESEDDEDESDEDEESEDDGGESSEEDVLEGGESDDAEESDEDDEESDDDDDDDDDDDEESEDDEGESSEEDVLASDESDAEGPDEDEDEEESEDDDDDDDDDDESEDDEESEDEEDDADSDEDDDESESDEKASAKDLNEDSETPDDASEFEIESNDKAAKPKKRPRDADDED